MSGHLRFCILASFLFAGLTMAAAAASNPLAALFGQSVEAAPQALAKPECLSRPGISTIPSQHWFYHSDGHRKCWFLAPGRIATSRRPATDRTAKLAAARNVAARKREAVADARDELLTSTSPQTAGPAPKVELVDVVPVSPLGASRAVPMASVAANPTSDQTASAQTAPPQFGGGAVLVARAPVSVATPSFIVSPLAASQDVPDDSGRWSNASWIGRLLIAMGIVSLLSASRAIRGAILVRKAALAGRGPLLPNRPSAFDRRAVGPKRSA
jgi:hypothetical protein